jgi:D-beta-D-heptose 7-phosphate kinase / D-beta-D-heptose 1-phosphate adenosyltransferase
LGEVLDRVEAIRRRAAARVLRKTFVFTNGCFDVLHAGHVALLAEAKRQGDVLLVGVNSDRSVRGLKGEGRPLQDQSSRAEILAAMRDVDLVVVFDEDTPLELIQALEPDVLVKGADYAPDQVEEAGGRVVLVPLVPERSSSRILSRLGAAP